MSTREELLGVLEAIGRGNGRFALWALTENERRLARQIGAKETTLFTLAAGAASMVRVYPRTPSGAKREGFVVQIGMTREHLLELRAKIDELLAAEGSAS